MPKARESGRGEIFHRLIDGSRLGPYEIQSPIGAGGMGEVYRARDTNLNRDVAIKVLPAAFAQDAERVARFRREAQVLASLNHSNIAAIFGLEESNGVVALALELVEGEELSERLKRGALPIDEAVAIGKQIAEGLEAAHEKGVVHRDLKPANLKLTKDGTVKILDFGLAKAYGGEPEAAGMDGLSQSPTMSRQMTEAGLILGTAAYMAPEQARGGMVDKRADIWAFGVVLFEMLTGKRLFTGETASDILAAVLKTEPEWDAVPASTPSTLRNLLHRCLTKEPRQRLQAIGEARIALEQPLGTPNTVRFRVSSRMWAIPWFLALVLALVSLALWAPWRPAPQPAPTLRLSAELGAAASLAPTLYGPAAILSPDGRLLVFVASEGADEPPFLHLRRMEQLDAAPLAGTEGARDPFFSPDGEWIAFFADGKLKKVSVSGGAVVAICDAENPRGGTWAEDGTIFFAPSSRSGGLLRVSSAGGTPQTLTIPDQASQEVSHRWPQALPGGKTVLYTAGVPATFEDASLVVHALVGDTRKVLHRGGYYGRYLASGHLVFIHEGTLFAAPFDLGRLELTGQPVPVLADVTTNPASGGAQFAFSSDGTVAYLRGEDLGFSVLIQWMDREGKLRPLRGAPGIYRNIGFSPDGRKLALDFFEGKNRDVWVYEWERDTLSRLTSDPGEDRQPAWTPDGRRIAFSSARSDRATGNLYWQRADGTGEAERLTESKNEQFPRSWHPSEKLLAFDESNPQTSADILILPFTGDEVSGWKPGKPTAFLSSPFSEFEAAFSPDGRWLAYSSNESGRVEVYVRPFPGPGGKWQVSTGGGEWATWSRSRRELFYRAEDGRILVAGYTAEGDSLRFEKPRAWSPGLVPTGGIGNRTYDLHPDGERVAVVKVSGDGAEVRRDKVVLIQNFFDELRRIAPVGKR
ncbi:MAG TPA: protein kinase [Vicinamibacteria bacterium]|nr:protein kinase [Vicinamibacteria bacterium]